MTVHDHLAGQHQARVDRAVAAAEVPRVELDPDGRPLVVVDLEGTPRDLIAWGVVIADTDGGTAVALVCTDDDTQPDRPTLQRLADALDEDRASRIRQLVAGELDAARDEAARARQALDEARMGLAQTRRELDQLDGLRAEVEAARQSACDVARLAVIALSRPGKTRRRLAHLWSGLEKGGIDRDRGGAR